MGPSPQDVYARHLQHKRYGYPLWMPEPMTSLPQSYQEHGLEIGDVGIVNSDGQFKVLFSVCKNENNPLHQKYGVPDNFKLIPISDADKNHQGSIPKGPIHSNGITRILHSDNLRTDYEFTTSTSAGAILVLPHGAGSLKLLDAPQEEFRKVAVDSALDWYKFAKEHPEVQQLDRTLYLITGLHKARSWSLSSFSSTDTAGKAGKIIARKDTSSDQPDVYQLDSTFSAPWRCDTSHSDHDNQAVFVTGFSITISSWFQEPVVLKATETETLWCRLVRQMTAPFKWLFSGGHKLPAVTNVNPVPSSLLSQPLHLSDTINRFLLDKNKGAKVAITHDTQWMGMMEEHTLESKDLLQEDRLGRLLTQYYDLEQENATVFLRAKSEGTKDPISSVANLDSPSSSESERSDSSTSEPDASVPPTPTSEHEAPDDPLIVITRIRAQNIPFGCKRMPIGFYVLVQFDSTQKRTQNKSIRLNDSDIEWDDKIFFLSQAFDVVRFTVYASFELYPMLGDGEVLYAWEVRLEELNGGTYLTKPPHGESEIAGAGPSLLITLGRWYSIPLAVSPGSNDSNVSDRGPEVNDIVCETNLGHEALRNYYNEHKKEDLESAVHHFERARRICHSTNQHQYFAAVLVNLAKAKSISYQVDPASAEFDALAELYRGALDLRRSGHADRPATLLQFAQILLFRYEKRGHDESVANEINELLSEFDYFSEDTHERRAANLVRTTLQRCKVVNSDNRAELDELVQELTKDVEEHRDDYFDQPQRLINLSAALWKRYEGYGVLGDPGRLLVICDRVQLFPTCHPDRLLYLKTVSVILWKHFVVRRDMCHLRKLIGIGQEALQLISEGHPEYSYWVSVTEPVQCLGGVYQPLCCTS